MSIIQMFSQSPQSPSIQVHQVPCDYHNHNDNDSQPKVKWTTSPPLPTVQRFPVYDFTFQSPSPLPSPTYPAPSTPHRKAPSPPAYSPRRARARHIRMQEPAKLGLFTVEEESNPSSRSWYRSSNLSTPSSLTPSSTTSTCSSSSSEDGDRDEVSTPLMEQQDPFALSFPSPLYTTPRTTSPRSTPVSVPTLAAAVNAGTFRPRRPPPLALSLITGSGTEYTPDVNSPTPMSMMLAPALPIHNRPRVRSPNKRHSPDSESDSEVDLVSALEELLTTCGEDLSDSGSEASFEAGDMFPLPPTRYDETTTIHLRSPSTPRRQVVQGQAPSAPKQKSRKVSASMSGMRVGGHSFLQGLGLGLSSDEEQGPRSISASTSASASSGSPTTSSRSSSSTSSSSSRSLPRRAGIPMEWRNVV